MELVFHPLRHLAESCNVICVCLLVTLRIMFVFDWFPTARAQLLFLLVMLNEVNSLL